MDPAERAALTMVCAELRALLAERDQQPEHRQRLLAEIESRARERSPILDLVRQLLGASPEEVRALGSGLPGFGPGQANEELFGCPDDACDRVCTTTPAGPIPRCALTGQRMVRR